MGLDNYARRSPEEGVGDLSAEDMAAFEEAGVDLCGGVLSGSAGSFRGKVYHWLLDSITGESIYQEWIPPARVKLMYEALRDFDPEGFEGHYDERFGDPETQIHHLREFFRICAERELGIEGSW